MIRAAISDHTQAAAGKADICMGCPGRQLCLSQSKSSLQTAFVASSGGLLYARVSQVIAVMNGR